MPVKFYPDSLRFACRSYSLKADFAQTHHAFMHECVTAYNYRMWANAQRDGRPAEYRWRPLFNTAKFDWRSLLDCHAVMLPRRESRWNLQGCPKLVNRFQPLVCRSSPYCEDIWRRYCCLTSFFPTVNTCLSCEDIARQSWAMVRRWRIFWRFFPSCIFSAPRAARFLTCILNSY